MDEKSIRSPRYSSISTEYNFSPRTNIPPIILNSLQEGNSFATTITSPSTSQHPIKMKSALSERITRKEHNDSYIEAVKTTLQKNQKRVEDEKRRFEISLNNSRIDLQTQRELRERLVQLKSIVASINEIEKGVEKQYTEIAKYAKLKVCGNCKQMLKRHKYHEDKHPQSCKEVDLLEFLEKSSVP